MIGPVHHAFGGSNWLLYSCSDGKSLVVVSDSGNPASPQYFVFSAHDDAYDLDGEGNGDRQASDAAFADLRALTPAQVREFVEQTNAVSQSAATKN